ncbi:MAG: type IV toxin-antitoxin system AbiEi family antitoxin domain-containing protein [Deltaproteobacteria bacterium]|nr:type IV toxin-antitoxin system AbiEi family antitoxin domain-containing protein [Deltaproteobacteria bacterium]
MSELIDLILEQIPDDVFTDTELIHILSDSAASRYNRIKRAIAKGEIIQIRRGLYCLGKRYQKKGVYPYELAQKIYAPSYISLESALSYHDLIPEAVYTITSASTRRSCQFKTSLGVYSYQKVPMQTFFTGVERIKHETHFFLMASPLKALCDYVFTRRLDWKDCTPLYKSLRIETDNLKFKKEDINELINAYPSHRVRRFLKAIRKELSI